MVRFETVAGRLPVRDAFASSSRVKHCPDEVDNIPTMRSAESTKKLLDSTNSLGERCNDTRSRARTIGMEDHCSTVALTINKLTLHQQRRTRNRVWRSYLAVRRPEHCCSSTDICSEPTKHETVSAFIRHTEQACSYGALERQDN